MRVDSRRLEGRTAQHSTAHITTQSKLQLHCLQAGQGDSVTRVPEEGSVRVRVRVRVRVCKKKSEVKGNGVKGSGVKGSELSYLPL